LRLALLTEEIGYNDEHKVLAKYTLTRSASERDLEWKSVFKSCPTKSMTGIGSKKDVADISEKAEIKLKASL
jgi:hypothetical protein